MAREILSYRLNTIHNLYYYAQLMERIQKAIQDDSLAVFCEDFLDKQGLERTGQDD
jgi:queuine tRNA-ribosyltransferase